MVVAHIGGLPVEEALSGLAPPLAIYLAAGGIAFRAARKRLARQVPLEPDRRPRRGS